MRRRRRVLWPRVALVLGGAAVGLGLAEAVARWILPEGGADLLYGVQATPPGMYAPDPALMVVPVPGFQATTRSLAGDVLVRLNQLGLRGPEADPPDGRARWLVLGDSFALSVQTPEERTFEALLAARIGAEVWNAGVDGYSTWQETARYRQVDDALGSNDVLLLYFLGNDPTDNQWFPETIVHWSVGQFQAPPAPSGLGGWLSRRSFLYAQLSVLAERRALAQDEARRGRWVRELSLYTHAGAGALAQVMPATAEALRQLRAEVERRGDRLVVALAPPAFEADPSRAPATLAMVGLDPADADLDAPRRAVSELLQQLQIPACDLVDPLTQAVHEGRRPYLVFDGHWSPEGHQVVADALISCLSAWSATGSASGAARTRRTLQTREGDSSALGASSI